MARSWKSRVVAMLAASHFLVSSTFAQTEVSMSSLTSTASSSPSESPTASPTASSGPKNYLIKVGADGFKYTPNSISNVSVGDVVTFEFYPPDHSVARAEFGSACIPYEYTGKNKTGFFSETQNVANVNQITHWNLTINSTEPIFFYCTAKDSCKVQGMVGVINPNDTQTLDKQIAAAKSADFMVAPGQPIPKEASTSLTNAPTTSPTTTTYLQQNNKDGSHGLSGGAIAGIVIGVVAFLVLCAALFFFMGRVKSLKDVMKHQKPSNSNSRMTELGGMETGELGTPEGGYQHGHHTNPSMGSANPHSPMMSYNEYGISSAPPMYGQHNATDSHPSGWMSSGSHNGHLSMMSGMSGLTQQQMDEIKGAHKQQHPVELHSPTPGQEEFPAELEAPGTKK